MLRSNWAVVALSGISNNLYVNPSATNAYNGQASHCSRAPTFAEASRSCPLLTEICLRTLSKVTSCQAVCNWRFFRFSISLLPDNTPPMASRTKSPWPIGGAGTKPLLVNGVDPTLSIVVPQVFVVGDGAV